MDAYVESLKAAVTNTALPMHLREGALAALGQDVFRKNFGLMKQTTLTQFITEKAREIQIYKQTLEKRKRAVAPLLTKIELLLKDKTELSEKKESLIGDSSTLNTVQKDIIKKHIGDI